MKKIICIILFLGCLLDTYATDPVFIYKTRYTARMDHYNETWSPDYEFNGFIISYIDRIVVTSAEGERTFRILGKVEKFNL